MQPERIKEITQSWYDTITTPTELNIQYAMAGAINQALHEESAILLTEADIARKEKQVAEDNVIVLQDQLRLSMRILGEEGVANANDFIRWDKVTHANPQDDMRALCQ